MSKEETVEVTIKLPKAIVDFIKDQEGKDVSGYITHCIMELHVSYLENVSDETGEDAETVMNQYNLKPVFKEYGVLPCYYKQPEAEAK